MDPTQSKGIFDALLNLGLPGICIIVLGFAVYKLWQKNNELQEKRLDESKQTTEALVNNANALLLLTDAVKSGKGT